MRFLPALFCFLCFTSLSACLGDSFLNFGDEVSSTEPSVAQVKTYRLETQVREDLNIDVVGLDVIAGIDKSVHFKFIAQTDDISRVFKDTVDAARFRKGPSLPYPRLEWWSPPAQTQSARFELATSAMSVQYVANIDHTLTILIHWFER